MENPAGVQVLLIEDDRADYLLTRQMFAKIEGRPFHLDWARSADEALEAITRTSYDVCLLDYRLGERNGLEVLREMLARGLAAPVIVLTGQTDYETDQAAMRAGAADYLVKGQVDPSMLERAIRYAMERKRVELALQNARDELESRVEERTAALSQANAELQQLAAALREADRRKDEFLAMLAHELRNPLGAISNAAQLLKRCAPEAGEARIDRVSPEGRVMGQGRGSDPGRLRRAVETLERQIRHQTRIVDDLLDVSRITRGKISLEREWFDLAWLIRHGVEDHRSAFETAGLALHLELPEEPVWLAGDRTRLNQVLENLLTNALKFTPTGGEVTVSLTVGTADFNTETRRHGEGQ